MSRCPTARVEEVREDGRMERRGRGWREAERRSKGGGGGGGAGLSGPVKDATRCQRLTGLQRAAVDGELHDAADEVVGGDLTAAMKDGFNGPDAAHGETVGLHVQDPAHTHTSAYTHTYTDVHGGSMSFTITRS